MANLTESDQWETGIYQIEEDDPVLGGPTGIDNRPPRELANRTGYLRRRGVSPWDASLSYPANVAYVSYGGTTWKSVGDSTNVVPGSDAAKWVRWAFTAAELSTVLGDAVAAHEAKADPHPQYATDEALSAHAADPNAHAQFVRHDAAQSLSNAQTAQARANINAEAVGVAATEVQKNAARYGFDTGAANTAVVTYLPTITSLTDGMVLFFTAAAANTGAMTLNVNGLGAKPLLGTAQVALQGGEVAPGGRCIVMWHAANNSFVLIDCTGAARQVGPATKSQHAMQLGQATGRLLRTTTYIRIAGVLSVSVDGSAFTSVGASAFTETAGKRFAIIEGDGAGGGSGGNPTTTVSQCAISAGGGGGSYGARLETGTLIGVPVSVGAAGAAGVSGGAGGAGGTTSFGSLLTVPGGSGSPPGNAYAGVGNTGVTSGGGAPTGANLMAMLGGDSGQGICSGVAFAGGMFGGLSGTGAPKSFGSGAPGKYNGAGTASPQNGFAAPEGGRLVVREYA